jgi:hypothetical protein
VLLWRADGFDAGALHTWPGITRARFNSTGTQVRAAKYICMQNEKNSVSQLQHQPPCLLLISL